MIRKTRSATVEARITTRLRQLGLCLIIEELGSRSRTVAVTVGEIRGRGWREAARITEVLIF